jgi:nitroreductase
MEGDMSVLEIVKKRRSIRKFKKEEIPKEKIERLKEALIWAPSAGNLQARKFYFVFNEEKKKQLARAALNQNFIAQAPLVVVGCCDLEKISWYGERGKNLYTICDVSAAVENLLLVAVEEGLGACWVGAFDEKEVSEILSLPDEERPIVLLPVGYPAESPSAPERASKESLIEEIG